MSPIEKYLPVIKEKLKARLGEKEASDKELADILTEVHKELPVAIRMVMKREKFITLCMSAKGKLLE